MTPTLREKFAAAVRLGYYWCLGCKQIVDRKNDGPVTRSRNRTK